MIRSLVFSALMLSIAAGVSSPVAFAETSTDRDVRMQWWREAKLGMFIHWGLYAIPAGEWEGKQYSQIGEWIMHHANIPVSEYKQLSLQFNPTKYDPDQWARIAQEAGMKYVVITSKHHDGFCLFDTEATDYDIVDSTPYGKDLLQPLAEACRKRGLKFCTYYSIMDWQHPAQGPGEKGLNPTIIRDGRKEEYVTYMKQHLKELIEICDTELLWFDGEWPPWWTEEDGQDLYSYLRGLKPTLIINNRVGKGRKGMHGFNKEDREYSGDFGTPEQEIPSTGIPGVDWEACMTMNDTWGFKKNDHNWKSTKQLLRNTVDIVSKGGNYLLNVGPTAEGEIPEESIARLREIGKWMEVNGESIYGTTASPCRQPKWGRITSKPNRLFLHIFQAPANGKLVVPLEVEEVHECRAIADPGTTFTVSSGTNGLVVHLPDELPDPIDTVLELQFEGAPKEIFEVVTPKLNGSPTVPSSPVPVGG